MPNIKSSKKAVKVIAKKTVANHELEAQVRNNIKKCEKAIASSDDKVSTYSYKELQSNIDKAVSKGIIKKNTAARQKKRLSKKIKEIK